MAPFPSATSKWHSNTYPALSPERPELSAKNRSVLITGAGTGIGAETARFFARAGASRIALLGRRTQPLLDTRASIEKESPGTEVFVASTDVTKKEQVDAAFDKFLGSGKLDVVISNAAVSGPLESVEEVDVDKFLEGVHLNLKGSLHVAQEFLRYASPEAVAIETSSAAAHLNIAPQFASYSVAKMAIVRMWDSLAYAHPNLSVLHTQPGIVDTDMNRSVGGVDAAGHADDVSLPASFNLWLASPEARFLKGRYLWANWDVDELKDRKEELEGSPQYRVDLVGWPFGEKNWSFQLSANASDLWK